MKDIIVTVFVIIIAIPSFFVLGILTLLTLLISRKMFYKTIGKTCKMLLFLMGVKLRINGTIPTDGRRFVVMTSHASFIELFLLPTFMRGQFFAGVTASSNLKIPLLGTLLKMTKVLPIDRGNSENAIKSMQEVEKAFDEGYHVMLNPEGTRSLNGKLSPLKKGGFHLAINTGRPIIPVGIQGAFQYKPKNRNTYRPGPVTINIGSPISTAELSKEDLPELVKQVTAEMKQLLGETTKNDE